MSGMEFVALDVETANNMRGSICGIGLAVVSDGQVVESHDWLVHPPEDIAWFDGMNISIHGIRPEMVADQPSFAKRWSDAMQIIGNRPIVAHNAGFDTGAIRQACDYSGLEWPTLDYGCSMVMSRKALDLISYRLPFVCEALGIELFDHHRAGSDALASAEIVLELGRRAEAESLHGLAEALQVRLGHMQGGEWHGCVRRFTGPYLPYYGEAPAANKDADPSHRLYGETIVFTGALSMIRMDAWAAAASFGATPEKGVTKRTTILVVGDGFNGHDPADFTTGKSAKAAAWRAKGARIEVLTEGEFYDILDHGAPSGTRTNLGDDQ